MSIVAERVYSLTELGRRQGSDVRPQGRDDIIDYIYNNKTARLSELASSEGTTESKMSSTLRQYERRGLIQQLTGG